MIGVPGGLTGGSEGREPAARRFLILAALQALVLAVYWPSLWAGAPRADQLIFLFEASAYGSPAELFLNAPGWNRVHGADVVLYRPLLYLLLVAELVVFGHNFFWWQFTALVLHGVSVSLLFVAMSRLVPLLWSGLLAALFAVNFIGAELVLWHHITGYVLFTVWALAALVFAQSYLDRQRPRDLAALVVFCALASFTYEGGLLVTMVLAAVAGWRRHAVAAVLLATVAAAYVAASLADFLVRSGSMAGVKDVFIPDPAGIGHAVALLAYWLGGLLLPAFLDIGAAARSSFRGFVLAPSPLMAANILALGGLALLWVRNVKHMTSAKVLRPMLPCFAMLGLYALLISYGRSVPRGLAYAVSQNVYYAYLPIAMVMLAIAYGLRVGAIAGRFSRPQMLIAVSSLGMLIAVSAIRVHGLAGEHARYSAPRIALIGKIDAWRAQGEGRRFILAGRCPANEALWWFDTKRARRGVAWSGYPRYAQVIYPGNYAGTMSSGAGSPDTDVIDCDR